MHIKLSIVAIVLSAISISVSAEPLSAQAFRDNAAAKAFASIAASDLDNAARNLAAAQAKGDIQAIDRAQQAVRSRTATMNLAQVRIRDTSLALQKAYELDAKAAANAPKVPGAPALVSIPPKPVVPFVAFNGGNNHKGNSHSQHGTGNGANNAANSNSAHGLGGGSNIGGGRSGGGFHY